MRLPRRVLPWTAGAVAVIVLAAWLGTRAPDDVRVGGDAPAFDLEDVRSSGRVRLADFRGKPVVVNFFASWCAPCRREMPYFGEIARKLEGTVAFVGINHQDSRQGAVEMLRTTRVDYPAGFDPDGSVAREAGLFGMPTTLFVDAGGRILYRRTGELSRKELVATLHRLFGVTVD